MSTTTTTTTFETAAEHERRRSSQQDLGWAGTQTPVLESGLQTPATVLSRQSQERLFARQQLDEESQQDREQHDSQTAVNGSLGAGLTRQTSAHEDALGASGTLGRRISRTEGEDFAVISRQWSNSLPPVLPDAIELGAIGQKLEHSPQGKPAELPNLFAELVFIFVCSTGQLLFSFAIGNITVNQITLIDALGIKASTAPWLVGAFTLANGLSVIVSGSLADLCGPRAMMTSAFIWSTVWNIVGVFSISPARYILFFVVRAMQGLAVGVLVSASMSVLGRIYSPGMRKTRVFSSMAAMAPMGFWVGALQGGALSAHLPWIFGSTAILSAFCAAAAYTTIPPIGPAKDNSHVQAPSLKDFDFLGAACASGGCGCLLFGLTQGAPSGWAPYTYSLIVVSLFLFVAFYLVERRAARPLIDNRLWRTPGFAPLTFSYFLGFGAYCGAWQFYAVRFWLTLQSASPLRVALYLTPNAIVGVLATFIVSKTLHLVAGHWILTASMLAYALGPVFFLPQTPNTSYWALSMPGISLVTFGPDLSFAAASIFITSSVAKSYQGSAGSVLVTVQNLSAAIFTAVGDSIGAKVSTAAEGELTLDALRAIWWFAFGSCVMATVLCAMTLRIPKSEEKEHVS